MSANTSLKTLENGSLPEHAPVAAGVVGVNASNLSQDIADLLSAPSPQETADAGEEQRRVPHYRVRWNAAVATDGQNTLHGFINDISMEGASIYLDKRLLQVNATLHILIPSLSVTSEPHVITVSGNIMYVVHDSSQQLFRAAISFHRFHVESDKNHLEERLAKCHLKIPEL